MCVSPCLFFQALASWNRNVSQWIFYLSDLSRTFVNVNVKITICILCFFGLNFAYSKNVRFIYILFKVFIMNNICVKYTENSKRQKGELSRKTQRMQMLIFTFTFTKSSWCAYNVFLSVLSVLHYKTARSLSRTFVNVNVKITICILCVFRLNFAYSKNVRFIYILFKVFIMNNIYVKYTENSKKQKGDLSPKTAKNKKVI